MQILYFYTCCKLFIFKSMCCQLSLMWMQNMFVWHRIRSDSIIVMSKSWWWLKNMRSCVIILYLRFMVYFLVKTPLLYTSLMHSYIQIRLISLTCFCIKRSLISTKLFPSKVYRNAYKFSLISISYIQAHHVFSSLLVILIYVMSP